MKVLVVCPTYGRIPYLNRMVASFLKQNYQNKKLVIINDDRNVQICFDHPLVNIININRKILLPEKRNLGSVSQYCDLIMPFDDDDIFLPNRIDNHVKMHRDNPQIDYYLNNASYIIYGEKFQLGGCSPNASSYKQSAWYKAKGYTSATNYGDDTEFVNKLDGSRKLEVRDESNIDYVYNFGGVNYHTSCNNDQTIEQKAFEQLQHLDLVGEKYHIEPDFDQFNNFIELDQMYKQNPGPITIMHTSQGVIDLFPF